MITETLNNIFLELNNKGIIKTYIYNEEGGEFSFNNTEESPHSFYIENENKITLILMEEFSEEERENGEENTITFNLKSIEELKDTIMKQANFYYFDNY